MKKRIFEVPDMHCPACVMTLEGIEDLLPGVKSIKASYHRQKMEVEFDESLVSEADIITAGKSLGYTLRLCPS